MDLSKAFVSLTCDLLIAKMHVYGFVKATRTKCKMDFFPEELILGLNLFNLLIYDFLLCFIETHYKNFTDDK